MAPPIVKRFLISLNQNKWLGLFVFLASIGGSVVFAFQPPPPPPKSTYKAIARLAFTTPPPAFTETGSQIQQQNRAITQEVLLSPRVLEAVAKKLNLTLEQIVEIRDKKIQITIPNPTPQKSDNKESPNQSSQYIVIEYTDAEPTKAKLVLDTFLPEMIEYSRWLNTSQLRNRIEALKKRLAQVQGDLTAAEARFYRYITKDGSDLLEVQNGSLFTAITSSEQKQREINLALQEIEGQIANISKQLGLNPEQAYTSSTLSADPIIAQLRANILDSELQLERLGKDLRPEHPTIVKLQKEKQVNESLLQKRAEELIGKDGVLTPLPDEIRKDSNLDVARQQLATQLLALDTQREGLKKQLESLQKTEQELRQQYEKFPDKQLQQARLAQEVEFQRVIYQNILSTLTDAQAAEAETVSSLDIAQEPYLVSPPPYVVPKKNVVLIVLAGSGIGLVASAGVIFLLAVVDDRLHSAEEIRDTLAEKEVLLLGQLPLVENLESEAPRSPILTETDSVYLPLYERFRSNIRRFGSTSSKVIIITSISNEEGKSVCAYNLAIASAQAGKRTLLVEADLRSPSQGTALEVLIDPEAIIEPLRYYSARTDSISLVPTVENLYILPSPGPQRQAAAIIESSELQLLLTDARGRFDMVVIDTPSLSKCNDGLLLEPLTDGIILVTRPGITRSSLFTEAIEQLAEAEVSVLGAVINSVENLINSTETPVLGLDSELPPPEGTTASEEVITPKVEV